MDPILEESRYLLNKHFSEVEIEILKEIERELQRPSEEYELDILWEYDSQIGGVGAYSMPADPKFNPFPGGIARTIFRPLQYARSQMDICDINKCSRYIIHDVGLHFEGLVKYLLKKNSVFGSIQYRKDTLGKALYDLNGKGFIEEELFESCKKIINIYNISKHNVNQDIYRSRSFVPMDAIIFYLAIRKVGNVLLKPYLEELYREIGTDIDRVIIHKSTIK